MSMNFQVSALLEELQRARSDNAQNGTSMVHLLDKLLATTLMSIFVQWPSFQIQFGWHLTFLLCAKLGTHLVHQTSSTIDMKPLD